MDPLALGVMLAVGENPLERVKHVKQMGFPTVQMGVPPPAFMTEEAKAELRAALAEAGVTVTTVFCGFEGESYADIPTVRRTVGLVPKETRGERLERAGDIAQFAKDIGSPRIAIHIGFVPEEPADPEYPPCVETLQKLADIAGDLDLGVALETGQETAPTLKRYIEDAARDNVGVNFDPANMILYGSGDPIEALDHVGQCVVGTHCKDGKWPTEEGQLGHETPLGEGDVGIEEFVTKLYNLGYRGPLTIEREITGDQQTKDILMAKELLEGIRAKLLSA
ncbi:MAG: sugar phosphate isomerase/epimerase family protein [Armatimonadota bacterium]